MLFSYQVLVELLLRYRYFVLFPIVMFEGPITTMVAGFLSSLGYFNFWVAYVVAVIADLTSDAGYYLLGRWGRVRFIERYGHYVNITPERIKKFEQRFRAHGGKMLLFGKIADPLSATMQTIAGMTRMKLSTYTYYNVLATVPKSLVLITVGYYFGEAIHQVDAVRKIVGILASLVGVVVVAAYFFYRKIKEKKLLEEHDTDDA